MVTYCTIPGYVYVHVYVYAYVHAASERYSSRLLVAWVPPCTMSRQPPKSRNVALVKRRAAKKNNVMSID
jgi:hypothetical protein